jgi:DNA-binding NtrC family response regulator
VNTELYPGAPVLLVDDEELVVRSTENLFRLNGITNVISTQVSAEVNTILAEREVSLVLLDLTMPGPTGEDVLRSVLPLHPDVTIVVVTGNMDIDTVVKCMRLGAADYLVKPVEPSRLLTTVKRLIDTWELRRENAALRHVLDSPDLQDAEAFAHIVSVSPRMKAIMLYVEAVARTTKTVLVTGPTGSGKELVAQAIHRASGRTGLLVPANVAGFDDTMFADTLFGHTKGAFTGADRPRTGLVETAAGGTLFLDEIGDLPPASQVKLLRLVESNEYYPLGMDVPRKARARVVAATNRDLPTLVEAGQFRKDLYYRLRTHQVNVPGLAERPEDIPVLVDHFLREACIELGKPMPVVPHEILTLLAGYGFPGNIRELKSMVFEAASVFDTPAAGPAQPGSRRRPGHLPLDVFLERTGLKGTDSPRESAPAAVLSDPLPTLRQTNEMLVEEALRRAKGNQTAAARMLGISQQALSKRLRRDRRPQDDGGGDG